ncbi:MAG: family 3 adenylate cyclase [Desulfobacteraceae bacterium IS3]|nr:MAG: family 3 adenylate cyclase [Desulfobacteraceae bacterium IS3]
MKRITYISKFASPMSEKQIEEIGEVSYRNNQKEGLTGVFLCVGGLFFQIIEGDEEKIDGLYAKIVSDKRHKDVLCLKTEFDITERLFPDWSMKTINLDKADNNLILPIRILLQSVTESHRIIEKYTQPSVFKILGTGTNPLTLKPCKTEKIILFGDIVAFSTLSEKYPVEDIVRVVNKYLDICARVISAKGGEVTKFIGDCVMAYFSPEQADEAIQGCLDILAELRSLRETASEGSIFRFLYCGFGLSQGMVIEGNIGSSVKMDYTVIGDAVNTAARLEALTRTLSKSLVLSSAVRHSTKKSWNFIPMGVFELKGKEERVEVCSIDDVLVNIVTSKAQIASQIRKGFVICP